MEVLAVLLAGSALVAIPGTFAAILRDGHGHTPTVRSDEPWSAGNLPSEPYGSANRSFPPALWFR
ncbi:hypothetical protein ACTWLI_02100 [Arthrobacter sp. Hor0625]|uniref:hypothetical protein n=1 Tax=Arthrobacter sp. Hor0625 TaxID=3457358 RepID=UPI00403EC35B